MEMSSYTNNTGPHRNKVHNRKAGRTGIYHISRSRQADTQSNRNELSCTQGQRES